MPLFTVVCRAASALYFAPDNHLAITNFQTSFGRATLRYTTRWAPVDGIAQPLPRGLHVEVKGEAPDLKSALSGHSFLAQELLPILTLAANAPTDDLVPELAYDSTDGITEREFFQQFLFDERLIPFRRPAFPAKLCATLLGMLLRHPDRDRLHRAMVQYHAALQSWLPGGEVMTLSHLYMGMEVLTPIARRRELKAHDDSMDKLLQAWAIDIKQLDPEVRRRVLFQGDTQTYRKAKEASDGFEHGFLSFKDIREHAVAIRQATARYLRRAILQLLDIDQESISTLTAPPFDTIPGLRIDKYIYGTLLGAGPPHAPDQLYPILSWSSRATAIDFAPDGTAQISFSETMTKRLGDGITLRPKRLEVWGGPGLTTTDSLKASSVTGLPTNSSTSPILASSVVAFILAFLAGYLSSAGLAFCMAPAVLPHLGSARWIHRENRGPGRLLPNDWPSLAWLGWPFFLPWFAAHSGGRRSLRLAFGLYTATAAPIFAALIGRLLA